AGSRLDLWRALVLHGIPAATGRELAWMLEETDASARFRTDLPASARSASSEIGERDDERRAVRRLWEACVAAVGRTNGHRAGAAPVPIRHRDVIKTVSAIDVDAWIHPPLIRFLAGYLDQGLAHWSMPERRLGIHGCFLEIYSTSLTTLCGG